MDCSFGLRVTGRVSELSSLQGLIDAASVIYYIIFCTPKKCDLSFHSMAKAKLFQKTGKGRQNGCVQYCPAVGPRCRDGGGNIDLGSSHVVQLWGARGADIRIFLASWMSLGLSIAAD